MSLLKIPNGKSGILFKGLCLVLLPLFVNSFLILLLNNSLSRAESLIEASRRQVNVVHKLTHATYAVTEILLGGNNAMLNGTFNFFSPLINRGWAILKSDLASVSQNISPDASYRKFQAEMDALLNRQHAVFIKSENPSLGLDSILIKVRRINEWVKIGGKQSRLLHALQEEVQEKYFSLVRAQQEEQKLVGLIVIVAIFLNSMLALFLSKLFQRNFTGRINALGEMAKSLPLNAPINETISGSDELQQIGVELAKVSWKLAEVAEYRRSLMQMMAHDVRSPLMAADISIATLESFLKDSISAQGADKLSDAGSALSNCLSLVNDLLLLESLENGETKPNFANCDLGEVMSSVLKSEHFSKANIMVSVAGSVRADREQIIVVIQRMIFNALSRTTADGKIQVTCEKHENHQRLSVRDDGKPLTAKESVDLLDKAVQASNTNNGDENPLGLAVAAAVMNLHDGLIGHQSIEDGNVLYLEFPLLSESLPAGDF